MGRADPRGVAIAVPCLNEAERVPALARALAALDPAPGAWLGVDDGSRDDTADRLEEGGFELLRHERNRGLGAARNTLWRRAEQRGMHAVAFLDADVLPPPDYLRRVCEVLGEGRSVAGVGGRNVDRDPGGRADAWRARFFPQELGPIELLDAPMLVGACATYRVSALRAVGGFSPRFRSHGEDVDLGRRLRAQGLRLRYDPRIVVEHHRRDDPLSLARNCFLHCREGMRATLATPGEPPGPRTLVWGMAKKSVRAPVAALVRRRDPREAAIAVLACGAALCGYAAATMDPG